MRVTPVLMSTKMTAGLLSVICVCTVGTGLIAGHVAEKHTEAVTTTRPPVTVTVPVVDTTVPLACPCPEPPPVPVPTGATTTPTTSPSPTTPVGRPTLPITLPEITLPTITLPSITLPTVTLPEITLPEITLPTIPEVTLPPPVTIPTVHLGAAAGCTVLGASTVTSTGPTVVTGDLCLWPGTSVTGFLPGIVLGAIDAADDVARQAQADLTSAYIDAGGRASGTIPAELGGLTLGAGVYAGAGQSPLHLTGTLTLDGEGDPGAVFIFQTDSTLITASGSNVRLINGARACNVFWQVGSSATLGTFSSFAGTIMALASITVTTGVSLHGRALARNAAVTLDTDIVTAPC